MNSFQILEEEIVVDFKKTFLNVNICFPFDCGWFYFFPDGAQLIPPPASSA